MKRVKYRSAATTVGAIVLLIVYAVPLYWLVSTSLKSSKDVFSGAASIIFVPTFQAYLDVWNSGFAQAVLNSVAIASMATIIVLVTGLPTAYALARVDGRIVGVALGILVILQMVPATSVLIPLYRLLSQFHATGNLFGVSLAIASTTLPFSILLLRPFFRGIPLAIEEAAAIDGAGLLRRFFSVVLPIARNGVTTVALLTFVGAWGEFLFAITFLSEPSLYPVSALLAQQVSSFGINWPGLMAVSVLVSLPTALIFLFGQRALVGGITMGSVR